MTQLSNFIQTIIKKKNKSALYKQTMHELGFAETGLLPDFVKNSQKYLGKLKISSNAEYHLIDQKLFVSIQGFNYSVTTKEEIYILNEIFSEEIYNFKFSRPCVVIDIGMNVGFSSLFFASKENVNTVIGYEPFKPTYERALENIGLNPSLTQKITPINLGVGIKSETRTVNYYEDKKGSVSITDDTHFIPSNEIIVTKEEISIIPASELFKQINHDYPNSSIICKMDCEGSEYDIFRSLSGFSRDTLPDIFMIEWHYKGNQELIDFLTKLDYLILPFSNKAQEVGMLYATKIQQKI